MTKNIGKTYERILLIHRKVYTYIHSNGIHRKVYTYIDTATAMNTFRDIHHPWPAERCISQPHRDNFTHTQSSWSLGWQEIKNRQQRELSKTKSDKIKASHILGLHTIHGAVCPQRAAHCRFIHKKQLWTPIHRCIHTAIYFQGTRAKPPYKAVWMDLKHHS